MNHAHAPLPEIINHYVNSVHGDNGPPLESLGRRAADAGLPAISVSHAVGRILTLLARLVDARATVEIGTLGGYSGLCLLRGMNPAGRLYTVEINESHARFARSEFDAAGVGGRVEIVRGAALDVLPGLASRLGIASTDLVFIDAVKPEYHRYFEIIAPCLRPGGLLIADNALSSSTWSITDPPGSSDDRDAMDRFNRAIARDPAFEAVLLTDGHGVLVARRR
ncbi:MAG: O-methyltransferase [Phycisphaerae bacterium]|nr:O-methyltransferase [Phycisphaerae bacterium]